MFSSINNLGFVASNLNCSNVKDYDKNTSNPKLVLETLNIKYNDKLIIANLNIDSILNKFNNSKQIAQRKADVLVITETKKNRFNFSTKSIYNSKLDSNPYMLDRNRNGSDVVIYLQDVQENISYRELKIHNVPEDIGSIFIEINLI